MRFIFRRKKYFIFFTKKACIYKKVVIYSKWYGLDEGASIFLPKFRYIPPFCQDKKRGKVLVLRR